MNQIALFTPLVASKLDCYVPKCYRTIFGTSPYIGAYIEEILLTSATICNRVFHFSSLKRNSQGDLAYDATMYSKTFATKIRIFGPIVIAKKLKTSKVN